jgi:hypothetical protein
LSVYQVYNDVLNAQTAYDLYATIALPGNTIQSVTQQRDCLTKTLNDLSVLDLNSCTMFIWNKVSVYVYNPQSQSLQILLSNTSIYGLYIAAGSDIAVTNNRIFFMDAGSTGQLRTFSMTTSPFQITSFPPTQTIYTIPSGRMRIKGLHAISNSQFLIVTVPAGYVSSTSNIQLNSFNPTNNTMSTIFTFPTAGTQPGDWYSSDLIRTEPSVGIFKYILITKYQGQECVVQFNSFGQIEIVIPIPTGILQPCGLTVANGKVYILSYGLTLSGQQNVIHEISWSQFTQTFNFDLVSEEIISNNGPVSAGVINNSECTNVNLITTCNNCGSSTNPFVQSLISGPCTAIVTPTTINGITITSSSTGSVTQYPNQWTSCGNIVLPVNSKYLGQFGSFTYTLNFSQPVNNLRVRIAATGAINNENFIFTTNTGGGIPSILTLTSCYSTVVGNQILSGAGSPEISGTGGGGGFFRITNSVPFTSITVSGNGGLNGSILAFCLEYVTP